MVFESVVGPSSNPILATYDQVSKHALENIAIRKHLDFFEMSFLDCLDSKVAVVLFLSLTGEFE
jgi:hypothetical protein